MLYKKITFKWEPREPQSSLAVVASKLFLLQSKAKQEEKKAILQDIQKRIDNNAPLPYRSWILKQLSMLG